MSQGFEIKRLQFKNFQSTGEILQTVDFDNGVMRVVTGEDLDAPKLKRSGIGKAQPLYSKVLTPSGWKRIGDLGVGDTVVTPRGTTTMVNGTYPQGLLQTVSVRLEDGRVTRACLEHLWSFTTNKQSKPEVANTNRIIELMEKEKVFLPLSQGVVRSAPMQFEVDPYLLGIALFCGKVNDAGYLTLKTFDTAIRKRLEFIYRGEPNISFAEYQGGIIVYDSRDDVDNISHKIQRVLETDIKDNLVNRASYEQQKMFFTAVCDLYGYDNNNAINIILPDEKEQPHGALLVREIAWALGGIAALRKKIISDQYMHSDYEYELSCKFKNSNIFFSDVVKRVFGINENLRVQIREIKQETVEECVCISLISEDKLYITDSYIVTHNTTVPNALSYALYNKPVSDIKLARLTNKRNAKGLYTRVDFSKDGTDYYIERGIKPDVFKFVKCGKDGDDDLNETYGTKADTQVAIERLIGMSHDLFTMIVTINTVKQSYMKSSLSKQRDIIEEILNISELTRKSKILSEHRIKNTKTEIEKEKVRIEAIRAMRIRLESNLKAVKSQSSHWIEDTASEIERLILEAEKLQNIDVEAEILAHQHNEEVDKNSQRKNMLLSENNHSKQLMAQATTRLGSIDQEISAYDKKQCPTCKQEIHDNSHEEKRDKLIAEATEYFEILSQSEAIVTKRDAEIAEMEVGERRTTFYRTIHEAYSHREKITKVLNKIEELRNSTNPFQSAIDESEKQLVDTVENYDELKRLEVLLDHQQFLQKILTGRDSFVRKRIIDVSIPLLNERIEYYLDKTDITHTIKFESDLTLEIQDGGEDYDFDNLSRGEQNWAIIALNLAMRDLFEQIHGTHNVLFVDELIDYGIDAAQSVDAFHILKGISRDRNKSLSLITHREELFEKADEILYVTKQNKFSTYERIEN